MAKCKAQSKRVSELHFALPFAFRMLFSAIGLVRGPWSAPYASVDAGNPGDATLPPIA